MRSCLDDCSDNAISVINYPVLKYLPRVIFLVIVTFLYCLSVFPQNNTDSSGQSLKLNLASSLTASELYTNDKNYITAPVDYDSVSVVVKPKLLPDKISFAENLLWGEDGLARKIGIVPALTREQRKNELDIRRTMLTAHQIGGFTTLALMLTTAYLGQKVLDGKRNYGDLHESFAMATILSYSATAALSVLSPPPLIRRDEESTTTLHKTLAWVHVAGMIITPILGSLISENHNLNSNKARFHQYAGYITTAVFVASMIVITF